MKIKLYVARADVHEFVAALLGGHTAYAEYRGENPFTLKIEVSLSQDKEITITRNDPEDSFTATVPVLTRLAPTSGMLTFTYVVREEPVECGTSEQCIKKFASLRAGGALEVTLDDGSEEYKRKIA